MHIYKCISMHVLVCVSGELHYHGRWHVSTVVSCSHEARDLRSCHLCRLFPCASRLCYWGECEGLFELTFSQQVNPRDCNRGGPSCQSSCLQGGIYVFQLTDFYGSTRACQDFVAICECVAIGWIFGGDWWTFFSWNCSPYKTKWRKKGKIFLHIHKCLW